MAHRSQENTFLLFASLSERMQAGTAKRQRCIGQDTEVGSTQSFHVLWHTAFQQADVFTNP